MNKWLNKKKERKRETNLGLTIIIESAKIKYIHTKSSFSYIFSYIQFKSKKNNKEHQIPGLICKVKVYFLSRKKIVIF